MAKNKFYAYFLENGNVSGIVDTWNMCLEITKGQNAKYKGFKNKNEAQQWLNEGANYKEKTNKFYAYFFVNENYGGITNKWSECQKKTKSNKCRYKSFKSKKEAQQWIDNGAIYQTKQMLQSNLEDGIYFDAGTGRGIGVETRVTLKDGKSILDKVVPKEKINEFGNYLTKKGSTNNFGELLGLYIALKIAIKEDYKKIFGDSKLVIEYWSKGFIKKDKLPEETVKLAFLVVKLRKEFESKGGQIFHVSGDINPADLGFH